MSTQAPDPTVEAEQDARNVAEIEMRRRKVALLSKTREQRSGRAERMEIRSDADGSVKLVGLASRTGVAYDVGFYRETIVPGAFRRTLSENPDVQLLVNHGAGGGMPLARTRSGTMSLSETNEGLYVEASLDPEDPDVQSLARKMTRGDIDQMSFAFQATDSDFNEDYTERTIRGVSIHRGDVSVVNMGANEQTFAAVRSREALEYLQALDAGVLIAGLVEWRDFSLVPLERRAGKALSSSTTEVLTQVLNLVSSADDAVDEAQPLLADLMGVPNPDAADEASERAAEPAETPEPPAWKLPDYTTRDRERLAVLLNGGRR
jgi:HK97 family phage prohead protease